MHFALIADAFPPLSSSAAVQLKDLANELIAQDHQLTVFLPSSNINQNSSLEVLGKLNIIRFKSPPIKDLNYFKRTINEFLMPFAMRKNFDEKLLMNKKINAILFYSPSIFHGPFVKYLKNKFRCKSYLIIRDIFPEWALDLGLLRKGFPFYFLKIIANYQYSVADIIGVQSSGNLPYFRNWSRLNKNKLEVLPNWLDNSKKFPCSIKINQSKLKGRKIFVYAGNMGIAQGMDIIINLAEHMLARNDIGFLLVGRGSEKSRLKKIAFNKNLNNILFYDEISPDQISNLYSQCCAGIVALSFNHKSHNIPGKFLTYMQNGLPCLANINAGNDLAKLIRDENVGQVCETNKLPDLVKMADKVLFQINNDHKIKKRCKSLFKREFDVKKIVKQIINSFNEVDKY